MRGFMVGPPGERHRGTRSNHHRAGSGRRPQAGCDETPDAATEPGFPRARPGDSRPDSASTHVAKLEIRPIARISACPRPCNPDCPDDHEHRNPRLRGRSRPGPAPGDALAVLAQGDLPARARSEEHTSELQSLMRISYAVFCL